MSGTVLDITDLTLQFRTGGAPVQALRHASLSVKAGEIVGIVGESGSGKSTLALTIMGLLPANAALVSGQIGFAGGNLLAYSDDEMRQVRGKRIAMVFQDPMTALNPVRSIGRQMIDIQHHDAISEREKRRRAAAALTRVGIPDAEYQLDRFAFQFSGGMRQRIAIAMGILQRPEILIADEITTALDVTLEAQMLHLLRELRDELQCAVLFISHNLGAVAEICDRVVVLYAGEVVEQGPIGALFARPLHPYTRALIECDPARIAAVTRKLPVIAGEVPNLAAVPSGCIFAARCPLAMDVCRIGPPIAAEPEPGHVVRCHLAGGPGP